MNGESDLPSETVFRAGLRVGPSRVHGRGVFTDVAIAPGDVVLRWGGRVVTGDDLASGGLGPGSWGQIEEDLFLFGPEDGLDYFLNHSCDPNVWLSDAVTVTARRAIDRDDEILGDYALWEADPAYRLSPCTCGTAACRTVVTGSDWRRRDLRDRYRGHFSPWLERRINARD